MGSGDAIPTARRRTQGLQFSQVEVVKTNTAVSTMAPVGTAHSRDAGLKTYAPPLHMPMPVHR